MTENLILAAQMRSAGTTRPPGSVADCLTSTIVVDGDRRVDQTLAFTCAPK